MRGVFYEDGSLVIETLGNRYLHGEIRLSEDQATELIELGWHEPLPTSAGQRGPTLR